MSTPTESTSTKPSTTIETPPAWLKRVAMVTGVLAGLAGFLTVRSANMSNLANYNSTQAVLHQAQSTDAWNEYEADSVKRHIDENSLRNGLVDPKIRAAVDAEVTNFRIRQGPEMVEAKSQADQRDAELSDGKQKLAIKDLLDYAGVAAQLGIALASVAALTRMRSWFNVGVVVGLIAMAITAYALARPFLGQLMHHL
jgi:hypothetical protein